MRYAKPLTLLILLFACTLIVPALAQTPQPTTIYLPLLVGGSLPNPPMASYVGGPGTDAVRGVAFTNDGHPVLAGRWPDDLIGGVQPRALPGGDGALVRLSRDGQTVLAAARIGASVVDLEASAAGPIIACGSFGLVAVQPQLEAIQWKVTPGDVRRCASDASGAAVGLVGTRIYLYNADGSAQANWSVPGSVVADVALDATTGLVFVTGYDQKAADLKVAYLRAYTRSGALRWTAYDFTATAIKAANLTADSEGRRVALGADGSLYLGAWTDGGNSIVGRDPVELSRSLPNDTLITFDSYNNPFNLSGARSLAWYGRFDPANGHLLLGQWLLTRLSDGKGNSIGIEAITADANGTVLITGGAFASMQSRTTMRLFDQDLGAYESNEAYLLVVAPDFRSRRLWTALTAPGTSAGSSPGMGVATNAGRVLLGATLTARTTMPARGFVVSANAPQPAPASLTANEGYYLLIDVP